MRLAIYLAWFTTKTAHYSLRHFKRMCACATPESQAKRIR